MELYRFTVQPVLMTVRAAAPGQSNGCRNIQEQGEMRHEASGRGSIRELQPREGKTTAEPLVSKSRVSEAVTEHDRSTSEGWSNPMNDMLAASCKHEKGLSLTRDGLLGCGGQQRFPDGFSHRGSTWLPGIQYGISGFPKCGAEEPELRTFSASFGAFERKKESPTIPHFTSLSHSSHAYP